MLRLAAVAAAMALGWATLELRSMIERNDASVLAMAEARPQPPQSQPPLRPQPQPAEPDCDHERVDTDGGVARTARRWRRRS